MPISRILVIAGSDSGGGAGIQADIKTISMLGGYAMTAITALTAQNTQTVSAVLPIEPDFITQQIQVVADDIGVDVIKTGMLHNQDVILAVAKAVKAIDCPLVLDPVMVATSGDKLLKDDAIDALKTELLPLADVVTPNVPEAELLSGITIKTRDDMIEAAKAMEALGAKAVLLKGGHLEGETLYDLLWYDNQPYWYESPRIDTVHTHGTGCTLASAVATLLGQGNALLDAVEAARAYVLKAIQTAPELGHGHGPLNHLHPLKR